MSGLYTIGHVQCDHEHQKLIEYADGLIERAGAGPLVVGDAEGSLADFLRLIIQHFFNEEKVMEQAGYPLADQHKLIHHRLISELKDFASRIRLGDIVIDQYTVTKIKHYVENHIDKDDFKFGAFLDEKRH